MTNARDVVATIALVAIFAGALAACTQESPVSDPTSTGAETVRPTIEPTVAPSMRPARSS